MTITKGRCVVSDDIVIRLRGRRGNAPALCDAAADEIERLRLACHYLAGWLSYHGVEPKEAVEIAYEKAVRGEW